MSAIPGTTPHGQPIERVDMGETEIPQEVFMEFMDNMRETYTADAYHLLGESTTLTCVLKMPPPNNFTFDYSFGSGSKLGISKRLTTHPL